MLASLSEERPCSCSCAVCLAVCTAIFGELLREFGLYQSTKVDAVEQQRAPFQTGCALLREGGLTGNGRLAA